MMYMLYDAVPFLWFLWSLRCQFRFLCVPVVSVLSRFCVCRLYVWFAVAISMWLCFRGMCPCSCCAVSISCVVGVCGMWLCLCLCIANTELCASVLCSCAVCLDVRVCLWSVSVY